MASDYTHLILLSSSDLVKTGSPSLSLAATWSYNSSFGKKLQCCAGPDGDRQKVRGLFLTHTHTHTPVEYSVSWTIVSLFFQPYFFQTGHRTFSIARRLHKMLRLYLFWKETEKNTLCLWMVTRGALLFIVPCCATQGAHSDDKRVSIFKKDEPKCSSNMAHNELLEFIAGACC